MSAQIFIGNIIHCSKPFVVEIIEGGFIIVHEKKIKAIGNLSILESVKQNLRIPDDVSVTRLTDSQLLVPGLVDTHIHAPQYPNAGVGYDIQLLEWLNTYTFPLEARYKDVDFARKVYEAIVKRTIAHGTTTACYFATIHLNSTLELCKSVLKYGQRALVGKVNMSQLCPVDLNESNEESLAVTEKFIQAVQEKNSDLLKPIITPRFALSCDMELMSKLGSLAKKYDVHIQTHVSENKDEINYVIKTYKNSYANVYDEANLLTKKTVLAHAVYLEEEEIKLLAERGTSVAHCPNSNICLRSGSCNVRRLLRGGVTVGLGTDVAGGSCPSIIDAMRCAMQTSIQISFTDKNHEPLSCFDVFYLATLGGAKALALENKIGNFEVGKDFDALIVDMNVENSATDYLDKYKPSELFQKFIYLADDRNVVKVFIAGKLVK